MQPPCHTPNRPPKKPWNETFALYLHEASHANWLIWWGYTHTHTHTHTHVQTHAHIKESKKQSHVTIEACAEFGRCLPLLCSAVACPCGEWWWWQREIASAFLPHYVLIIFVSKWSQKRESLTYLGGILCLSSFFLCLERIVPPLFSSNQHCQLEAPKPDMIPFSACLQ